MRYLIVAVALCAACGAGETRAPGAPPSSTGESPPGNGAVIADSAKVDVTGPNGPRTGG